MRSLYIISFLLIYLYAPGDAFADNGTDLSNCTLESAVYKPHPSYRSRSVDFTMTVEKPRGGQTTLRWNDYYIHAYSNEKEVSSYRMSVTCGNGAAGCFLGGSEFLELDQSLGEYRGKYAPYAYILSHTPNAKKFSGPSEDLKFFTKDHTPPNFDGITLWILDSCNKQNKINQ